MTKTRLSPAEAHQILWRYVERRDCAAGARSQQPQREWTVRVRSLAAHEAFSLAELSACRVALVFRGNLAIYTGRRPDRPWVVLTPGHTLGPLRQGARADARTTARALTRCEIWLLCPAPERQAGALSSQHGSRSMVPADAVRPAGGSTAIGAWLLPTLVALAILAFLLPAVRAYLEPVPMALGQWCSERGYDSCAERAWRAAAWLAPGEADAAIALGVLYAARGDRRSARETFESALTLMPESSEALNNLGVLYAQEGDYERAIVAFRQALAADPGAAQIEANLARSLHALGAYDEALSHFQAALVLGEAGAGTWLNMALAYYWSGEMRRAEEAAQQAIALDQGLAPAYTLLGAVKMNLQEPGEAQRLLTQAVALDPSAAEPYLLLGRAWMALNRPDEAELALARGLDLAIDADLHARIEQALTELRGKDKPAP